MSRRQLLAAAAAAPFASAAGNSAHSARSADTTFVLFHGAWHGGWCWSKLAPLLQAKGCRVLTPTLTGLGEPAHLLGPEVDLERVALVGHSYGGMVIAEGAARVVPRVSQLIYLDAFLPDSGKALRDYAPVPPRGRTAGAFHHRVHQAASA